MGLENVKKGLAQEAQAEVKRAVSWAQKAADETLAQAKENASKIRAEAREKASQMAAGEANERASAAELKAKKILAQAMNKKMDEALEMAWNEFAKKAQSKDYEKMMKALITGAEKELGAKTIVQVNEDDLKIAKKYSKNVSSKTAEIAGGAIISTADGRISINNSLESIFEQGKDGAKRIIYAQMMKGREE